MERREFMKAGSTATLALVFPGACANAVAVAGVGAQVPPEVGYIGGLPPNLWSPQTLAGLNLMTLEARHEATLASRARLQPSKAERLGPLEPATLLRHEFSAAGALRPGAVTMIAGRRASGATALALSIIWEFVCEASIPVALFSTDMSGRQAMERIFQNTVGVDAAAMSIGLPCQSDFERMRSALTGTVPPLYVDDRPDHSVEEIVASSRALKSAVPALGLVVVDEFHRTAASSDGCVPTALRRMASELHVPVLLVSRLYGMLTDELPVRPRLRLVEKVDGVTDNVDLVALIWRDLLSDHAKEGEWWWQRFEVAFHNLRERTQRECAFRFYGASGRFGVWV